MHFVAGCCVSFAPVFPPHWYLIVLHNTDPLLRNASRSDIMAPGLTPHPSTPFLTYFMEWFVYFLVCLLLSIHTHFPLGTTFCIRGLEVFYGMGSRYVCELASLVSPNKWYGLFGRCAPGQWHRPRHVFVGRASGSAQPPRLDHALFTHKTVYTWQSGSLVLHESARG